jgi:predicted GNAT family N-acyltransferase
MIDIELCTWEKAREEASRIRFAVFVEEQRVPPEIEMDEFDAVSVHALARSGDGKVVATGRLLPDGHVGRMAVTAPWRGKGVGGKMLEALVEAARKRGDGVVILSAQTHAVAFYRRYGFTEEGAVYEEAGIPHQTMRRVF